MAKYDIRTQYEKYDIRSQNQCQNRILMSKYDIRPQFESQNTRDDPKVLILA